MSPYIYDIALIVIMLLSIGMGFKKGVLRTVLSLVCLIIAFSAASVMSSAEICSAVYDKYFHEYISEHIDSAVEQAKNQAKDKIKTELNDVIDSFIDENLGGSGFLKDYADNIISRGEETASETIPELYAFLGIDVRTLLTNPEISGKIDTIAAEYSKAAADALSSRLPFGITVRSESVEEVMSDLDAREALVYELFGIKSEQSDTQGAADYLEKAVVRPIFLRFIGIVIWTAVFAVVNFVLRIVIRIILIVRKIEPIKACDSLLGGACGAAAGIAVIAACSVIIVLLIRFTGGLTYMNEDIFEQTILFKKVYDFISGWEFIG